jgi:hypothetical protein
VGLDPTTMYTYVRQRTADLLREAERDRLAVQALDALPLRLSRRPRAPRLGFRLPFSVRLVIQRRDVAL